VSLLSFYWHSHQIPVDRPSFSRYTSTHESSLLGATCLLQKLNVAGSVNVLSLDGSFGWFANSVIFDTRIYIALNELSLEICPFLGYYAALSGSFVPTLQDSLLVPSSRDS
jgi:hypothetical protein